ncbi:hypothetical protein AM493_04285 [Flavobacterium akiainvivens]|uniref:Tetratricopeptide repeat protein n=1 Tax=Flavobacterium akiainvivens TaxID=1202724 RepID=A0A0M8MBN0_9FLAO|nr:tetratricopeptide repeat protein [Flavobacterium akiainvivens]KOS05334.1 hypothetical protein AM493_04285 [Flavobacterium akiainvivens]SFQ76654.1 Tetratricopeptide repeat-containing protein [Flavobacterium akiainvivens]
MKHLFFSLLFLPFIALAQQQQPSPQFTQLVKQADSLAMAKQYKNAIEAYSKAIAINPDKEVTFRRGAAYLSLQQHDKAIADFTYAINHPDISHSTLTTAYYMRGLCKLLNNGEYTPTGCDDLSMAKSLGLNLDEAGSIVNYYCP